jgi:hypothetical protein
METENANSVALNLLNMIGNNPPGTNPEPNANNQISTNNKIASLIFLIFFLLITT